MKNEPPHTSYILGLDIGVASIGWTLLGLDNDSEPTAILRAGVHIFEAGVEGDVESGRDKARGSARREARLPRRMHWRRQRRRQKLLRILQQSGLLPPGDINSPQAVHDYLLTLDADLRKKHLPEKDRVAAHLLPYRLRAAGLDRRLEPFELGRAFYHLAQRRGFLSNRKSLKKDEDEGIVEHGINDLRTAMGTKTLGQYFASLDPEAERIRRKWTARSMYVAEFNRIWDAQSVHHSELLSDNLRKEMYLAIFFQRPLKSSRHLIGKCELVHGARRAALADRLAQRFRILQKVNDLECFLPDASARRLANGEREKLIEILCRDGDLSFAKIKAKAVLGLPKGSTFNFEREDEEKGLPGHRTDQKMRSVFGNRWDEMTEHQRDTIVLEVLSFQNPEALERRGQKAWGLDEQAAKALAATRLEPGYGAHSRKAYRQLVGCMQDGTQYATARKRLFPESFACSEPINHLPPVLKAVPSLRNPAVARVMTELRKLVNEIVRVYGKPHIIRIELARDLKRSRKERERRTKEIDAQTKLRAAAKAKILAEMHITEPRRSDIEKVLLAEECGWHCPYTSRQICMQTLLGEHPQFDVEHILPFCRSLDNSFLNKTLCYHEENRDRKRNRMPFEAYSHDSSRYAEMLTRVRRFHGRSAHEKLRRFEMEQIPEGFVSRQLNDTRYASRLAGDYLALLYGGRADAQNRQRIQISTGGITAHLRNEWMLNSILCDGGEKTREDHRHHAVDALAVAFASPRVIQQLERAAERASGEGRRLFARVQEPWPGFLEQAREKIMAINVSCRQKKRIAGVLHAESLYSKPIGENEDRQVTHIRKALSKLSLTDLKKGCIVDRVIRRIVHEKWQEMGSGDPKRIFADDSTHPFVTSADGRKIPIHKVRVISDVRPWKIGQGARERFVTSKAGTNHHAVIIKSNDAKGRERWEDKPVSRYEVYGRKPAKRKSAETSIIQREWGNLGQFLFSLAPQEYIIVTNDEKGEQLYRIDSISEGDIEFRLHFDARTKDELKQAKARMRAGAEKLRKCKARKVRVTYLGEIVPAND